MGVSRGLHRRHPASSGVWLVASRIWGRTIPCLDDAVYAPHRRNASEQRLRPPARTPAAHERRAAASTPGRGTIAPPQLPQGLTAAPMLHPPPNEPLPHLGRRISHAPALAPHRLQHSAALAYLTVYARVELGTRRFTCCTCRRWRTRLRAWRTLRTACPVHNWLPPPLHAEREWRISASVRRSRGTTRRALILRPNSAVRPTPTLIVCVFYAQFPCFTSCGDPLSELVPYLLLARPPFCSYLLVSFSHLLVESTVSTARWSAS
ncbi:hypothetical protein C8J57DRAFT_1718317 [Mycena rebaudengoi]|nr:hypothetical protein C8J57DRAFT_1718317 [Mycena rebaudengoi]